MLVTTKKYGKSLNISRVIIARGLTEQLRFMLQCADGKAKLKDSNIIEFPITINRQDLPLVVGGLRTVLGLIHQNLSHRS